MRGRKGRGGVAGIIGGLLRVGSPGSGSSVANGANLTERRCRVNHNMGSPFVCLPASPLLSIPGYSQT
jgi:hypothetical protein